MLTFVDVQQEIPLAALAIQPAEKDTPLRMWALDVHGRLWTRLHGSAGWSTWQRAHGPAKDFA